MRLLDVPLERSIRRSHPTNQKSDNTQWVRLVPPGVDDDGAQLAGPLVGHLATAVEALSAEAAIAGIEYLSYPTPTHYEYLLRANRSTATTAAGESVTDVMISVLERQLIDRIGIDIVAADTAQLVDRSMTTMRLVDPDEATESSIDESNRSLNRYLQALLETGVPHCCRIEIGYPQENGEPYLLDQQVAVAGVEHRCWYPHQYAAWITDGLPPAVSTVVDHNHLRDKTSSLSAAADTLSVRAPSSTAGRHHGTILAPAGSDTTAYTAARMLVLSHRESAWFNGHIEGAESLRRAYAQLDLSPTLTVPPEQLSRYIGFIPGYNHSVTATAATDPSGERQSTIRPASGTDQATLTRPSESTQPETTVEIPPTAQPANYAAGSPLSQAESLIERACNMLVKCGDKISADTTTTLPVASVKRSTPADHSDLVIIGPDGRLTPGDIIALADRQSEPLVGSERVSSEADGGTGLTIITKSESIAQNVCQLLQQPYKSQDGEWTTLQCQSTQYWQPAEALSLVDADATLTWQINPDGTLQLLVDGSVAAMGSTSQPPRPTQKGPPIYFGVGDPSSRSLAVIDTDGRCQCDETPVTDLTTAYQAVPAPAVPTRPSYATATTVMYAADNGFGVAEPSRLTATRETTDLTTELRAFLSVFTAERAAASMEIDQISKHIKHYLHPTTPALPSAEAVKDELSDIKPEYRVLPDDLDEFAHQYAKANSDTYLVGRTWRYPLCQHNDPFGNSDPNPAMTRCGQLLNGR